MLGRFQRIFTASIGAAVLSAACAVGAAAPAKAEAPTDTIAGWQSAVNHAIDAGPRDPRGAFGRSDHAMSTIAVRFDAQGGFDGAAVARSSGSAAADREALRTARAIRYPALPVGLRGRPRTIVMQVYFGDGSQPAEQGAEAARLVETARAIGAIDDSRTASR